MADRYYRCALQLWPEKSWKNLLFSGGVVCRLESLREEIQGKFRSRYRITSNPDDTLFGLLILASVCSGRSTSVEQLSNELRALERAPS